MNHTATYSPDDNKLRLYPAGRLDADEYARVKAAGFKWAPKQGIFVAPMWTPGRADLLIEMAGEIGDEDKSLTERAEERADRFEEYHDKRTKDAESARRAVASIADGIPFGQPILIGHHSEKHARRDAERIESGMRKAVKAWETAQYWTGRAHSAIRHAKYKELPAVRARRIKGIEADKRKQEKYIAEGEKWLKHWNKPGLTLEEAQVIAGYCRLTVTKINADGTPCDNFGGWSAYDVLRPDGERYTRCPAKTVQDCIDAANKAYPRMIAGCRRWIEHYDNRLAYERAMLADAGGLVSDRQKFEVGGRILRRGQWMTILKVNAQSVTVSGHWARTVTFDEIKDYQAPTAEQTAAVTKAFKIPPLCNYPGAGFLHMTKAELDAQKCRLWSDFPKIGTIKATATHGAHRVQQTRAPGEQWKPVQVYVTDAKRKDPPALVPDAPTIEPPRREIPEPRAQVKEETAGADFEAMRDSLKAGVRTISAPQLFPTPPALAAQMVDLAGIEPEHRVLEPSAGTGNILNEVYKVAGAEVVAVEISPALGGRLEAINSRVVIGDFLKCQADTLWGMFDRIVMNPPFIDGADIKHIQHAAGFLKPGGRLVAICANGPRQREQLMPMAAEWHDLPPGSFKESGTMVNTALLVIEA